VTAEPTGQELNIGERVDYTRAHLPATQRERYEQELREATERALATGDYSPLGNVVERWWRAARLEDYGGSSWQRQKRLAEKGRWDELFPGPGRDVDEVVEELLR
jgi:Family of unknown function (DUF6247)